MRSIGSEIHHEITLDGGTPFTLFVRTDKEILAATPEAYLATTLLPAMQSGFDLHVDQPICAEFEDNLSTLQQIYATWYTELNHVSVQAPLGTSTPDQQTDKTASFFTGGVDSFYTLLKHEPDIDALIYVHGFDVTLDNAALRRQIGAMLHDVGAQFGKDVIELETNLRDFSDRHIHWERYHGSALAAVALSLQENYSRVFIPSSFPYDLLRPWGSSPLTDPLWGTLQTELIHDGCEANRLEKCQLIGKSDAALKHLRVCWENRDGQYNCGQCEKCIRTMVQLLAADVLHRTPTFAEPLNPSKLARLPAVRQKSYHYLPPLHVLEANKRAPDVCRAIRRAVKEPSVWRRATTSIYNAGKSLWQHTGLTKSHV